MFKNRQLQNKNSTYVRQRLKSRFTHYAYSIRNKYQKKIKVYQPVTIYKPILNGKLYNVFQPVKLLTTHKYTIHRSKRLRTTKFNNKKTIHKPYLTLKVVQIRRNFYTQIHYRNKIVYQISSR